MPATPDVVDHAEQSIAVGSKSFAAAAKLFAPETRESAVLLYAWCRHCDDVIDGQELGHGQVDGDRRAGGERLAELERLTRAAYGDEPLQAPAFAAFQRVVRRHGIPLALPLDHLAGFRMDVEERVYVELEDTLEYCYHVAGVVGVMMARIMGAEDEETLDRACDLGMAFQLTNIARDIVEDARIGRVYLPRLWLDELGVPVDELAAARGRGQRHRPRGLSRDRRAGAAPGRPCLGSARQHQHRRQAAPGLSRRRPRHAVPPPARRATRERALDPAAALTPATALRSHLCASWGCPPANFYAINGSD